MKDLLIKNLTELKSSFGATGVKAEFESEGATLEEVQILKSLADCAGLDFVLKIGGCEALRDLKDAKTLGITTIVAPMIESEYAFTKFINGARKIMGTDADLWINIETMNGYIALDDILKNEKSEFLSGIVFGRTDFAGSVKIDNLQNPEIYAMIELVITKVRAADKKFVIGGGITPDEFRLKKRFHDINGMETRKILFDSANLSPVGIEKALQFEINWLKFKQSFSPDESDRLRLEILQKRCL